MDERPAKRHGPLTWLSARTWRFWVWLVVVALLTPVLYVASSGPMKAVLWTRLHRPGVDVPSYAPGAVWGILYGPLDSIANQLPYDWCTKWLWVYWDIFPVFADAPPDGPPFDPPPATQN